METPYELIECEHAGFRRVNQMAFVAVTTAVGCSRVFAHYTLRWWGFGDLIEDGELLTSELMTNAVKAADPAPFELQPPASDQSLLAWIRVRMLLLSQTVVVQVWDPEPTPPVLPAIRPDAEGGRGLHLVEAIARRWGHFPSRVGGKVVWCELPIPQAVIAPRPPGTRPLPYRLPPTTSTALPSRRSHRPRLGAVGSEIRHVHASVHRHPCRRNGPGDPRPGPGHRPLPEMPNAGLVPDPC